ncbi:hypothetical protein GCM10023319_19210 [Nocardia iowensis]
MVIRICQPSSVVTSRDLSASGSAAAVPLPIALTITQVSNPKSPAFVPRIRMNTPHGDNIEQSDDDELACTTGEFVQLNPPSAQRQNHNMNMNQVHILVVSR